jgi:hypothetical protein
MHCTTYKVRQKFAFGLYDPFLNYSIQIVWQ